MRETCAFDMFNNQIHLNDKVEFFVDHISHTGYVNMISNGNRVRINSITGVYRRKGNNIILV